MLGKVGAFEGKRSAFPSKHANKNVPFCKDTFLFRAVINKTIYLPKGRILNNFIVLVYVFSCGSPKQRVYKGNNWDSNFYLNFDKIFALSSLHLQHVTKGTDLPKLTLSLRQERKNENNQTLSNVSSCEQKSRRKLNNARKVPVASVKSLTIDHDISWETCLSFACCVEGKQRLNKDIFVLAFVNLDEIPISQAYKKTDMSRPNHI